MALALAGLAVWGGPPAARARGDVIVECNEQSWVGGSVDICDGTLVYRDYVYDDYGADSGSPAAGLSDPDGDGPQDNLADIVSLRLRVEGQSLRVTFELNTMFDDSVTVGAIAVDTDGNEETGGGQWGPLPVASKGWEVLERIDRRDPATNLIEGTIPLPPGSRWGVQAVTAVGLDVRNVAFRGTDESGTWWDEKQATALGSGDISEFRHVVDVSHLVPGATVPALLGPGLHERVYTSKYTVPPGEGLGHVVGRNGDGNFAQSFRHLGKYQPYGVYIPDKQAPHGLHLALHGYSANHSSLVASEGLQQRLGEDLNRIIVVPLGRGEAGYYSDYSERDVLDVLADLEANYQIDRDRVFSGGYSMGGYGTLRFASLYPDRFAGYTNWVGYTGDCMNGTPFKGRCPTGAVGNVIDFVGNLRHVPGTNWYAGADELVHLHTGVALNQAMADAGIPYVYYLHPVAEHFTPGVLGDWRKEAAYTKDLVRVKRPRRVTYRTDLSLGNASLGIAHDKAYWVSGIKGRDAGFVDVDVTSSGCGGAEPIIEPTVGAGPDPVPYVSQGAEVTGHRDMARANRIEASLANAASFTVDVGDACLSPAAVSYTVTTDGPATVALSDGRTLVLSDAGTHEGEIAASPAPTAEVKGVTASAPAPAPASGERLPATGADGAMAALGAGLLGLVLAARRLA